MEQKKTGFRHLLYSAVIFSVMLFIAVLAVGGAVFMIYTKPYLKPHKNDELAKLADDERERLQNQATPHADAVTRIAVSRFLQRYFSFPDNDVLTRMAFEELGRLRTEIKGGTLFWVNDTDKKLYHNGRYSGTNIDPSKPVNIWYMAALLGSEGFNINAYHNPETGKSAMRIAAPVHNADRKAVGVVGVETELSAFIDTFYNRYSGKADLFFFNALGEIACSRDIRAVTSKMKLEDKYGYLGREIMAAAEKIRYGGTQTFTAPIGDIALSSIPDFEWFAIAVTPHAQSGHMAVMTRYTVLMAAALIVILIIFNVFIVGLFKPLRETMGALEAALKVKDDFLAKMSHEIRTPMNAITGMAELALREEMSPPAQEHVYTIKQAGANLLSIINDILDLSKIESGKLKVIPAEYHFAALVNDVVSIIRMRAVNSSVRFVVNADSRIPSVLIGDEVRVRQILLNILSNAVKYTSDGFISLVINGETVEDDTVILTIDVADTGKGIKPEDLAELFGAFVQVDVESNRGIEGTGLGLVITKNLTAAMGGRISVESEYGKGSTFTVTLPQKIYTAEPSAAVDRPHEKSVIIYERRDIYANSMACTIDNLGVYCASAQSPDELRAKLSARDFPFVFVESTLYEDIRITLAEMGCRAKIVLLTSFGNVVADKDLSVITMPAHSVTVANILNGVSDGFSYHTDETTVVKFNAPEARVLVVDDIKTNLEVTKGLLSPYDMRVDVCLSGAEAVELAKDNVYDLIFMDHMMPEMDGVEAAKRIRDLGGVCSKTPIVALTANAVSGAKEMFLRNDFNGFLSKPVDIPNLNAVLERWIPKKKQKPVSKKTERMEAAASEFTIDGIDVKGGIARMGGNAETYMRTLSIFCSDGWEKIAEIRNSLESGDIQLFASKAHAVKGASANIGAMEISELAKDLELAGKRGDQNFVRLNAQRFLEELGRLLRSVEKAVAAQRENRAAAETDIEAVKAALTDLGKAINALDPDAMNAASANLRGKGVTGDLGAKIEIVLQNTLIGEYEKAIAQIQWLLRGIA